VERYEVEKSLGFLLAKTHQYFSSFFKEKLNKYSLTPPQFAMLAFLWKRDGLSQIQLGNCMNTDRTTISGIVDRLEKDGLVTRRRDPEDRRTYLINLTPRAFALQDEMEEMATQAKYEVTAMLSDGEKEQLERILRKILDAAAATRGCWSPSK